MATRSLQNRPIGIFDSGIGGLTVAKAVMRCLPNEDIIYFGDTARVPYGTKSPSSIIQFSKENAAILLKHKVKAIIVACNSSSSYALRALKQKSRVPVIGVIQPGARQAVQFTKNCRVGVIATPATIQSGAYTKHIKAVKSSIRVTAQACPLFVPLVEEGWLNTNVTMTVAQKYLKPLKAKKVDTLILGCTHYPLLKSSLKKVMGPKVTLVDSAQAVAMEVKKVLTDSRRLRSGARKPKYTFLISDEPKHFRAQAKRFLGFPVKNVKRCESGRP